MKKRIISAILILVLAVSAFSFTSCDETELGLGAFIKTGSGFTEMYKSMFEGFGALYTENSDKNIVSDVELTMKSASNEVFNKILPATIKGNAVYNIDGKKLVLNATAGLFGKEIKSDFYVSEGDLYFTVGTGKYVKVETSESSEGLDIDLNGKVDTVAAGLQSLKDLISGKITTDDITSEITEVTVDGEKINAVKITLELDEERLAEIASAYENYREETVKQLQEVYAFLKTLAEENNVKIPQTEEEIKAWLSELKEKIKASDLGLQWEYLLGDGKLLGEKVTLSETGKKFVCSADYKTNESGSEGFIKLAVADSEGNERVITSVTYSMQKGETENTFKAVIEVPGKEKTFKTEMTSKVTKESSDICIRWMLGEEVITELDGKLICTNTEKVKYVNLDGTLKVAGQEFCFAIVLNTNATGEKELVIPEFTEENTVDYSSYLKPYATPDTGDKAGFDPENKLGNGKIDIELPANPYKPVKD